MASGTIPDLPEVEIELRQGTPKYVVNCLPRGTRRYWRRHQYPELETFSCFSWEHVAVVGKNHPLAQIAQPPLADLARYPIITYNPEFSGRSQIDAAFEREGPASDDAMRPTA